MQKIRVTGRIFSVLSVFVLTSPLGAETPDTPQNFFRSGPYTGFSLGYSYMNSSVRNSATFPVHFGTLTRTATVHSNGVTADIFAGYRHFLKDGYALGADLTLAVNNNEISKNMALGFGDVEMDAPLTGSFQVIPAVSLGKQFSDRWLGFLKVGANIAFFSSTFYFGNTGYRGQDWGTHKKTTIGPMVAAGGEYVVDKNVSLLGTVSYLGAQKFTQTYAFAQIRPGAGFFNDQTAATTFKPYWVTAKVSLLYQF